MTVVGNFIFFSRLTWEFLDLDSERGAVEAPFVGQIINKIIDGLHVGSLRLWAVTIQ